MITEQLQILNRIFEPAALDHSQLKAEAIRASKLWKALPLQIQQIFSLFSFTRASHPGRENLGIMGFLNASPFKISILIYTDRGLDGGDVQYILWEYYVAQTSAQIFLLDKFIIPNIAFSWKVPYTTYMSSNADVHTCMLKHRPPVLPQDAVFQLFKPQLKLAAQPLEGKAGRIPVITVWLVELLQLASLRHEDLHTYKKPLQSRMIIKRSFTIQ